jgi:hypothetical protein
MNRYRLAGPVLFALALGLGCSGGGGFGDVSGEVTLDDQPLDEGVVRFVPIDGKTPTASALIAGGKFREKVPVGSHRVEISAPKLPKGFASSKELKRGTVDEGTALEELIPRKYNADSELKADVKSGSNTVRFDLKSKG